MALIIHRCTCGHPDFFHRASGCDMNCICKALNKADAPEILPTWNGLGQPVTAIVQPGEKYNHWDTCACDACKDLYADYGGVAA